MASLLVLAPVSLAEYSERSLEYWFSPQSVPPGDGAPDQTSCAQFNGGEASDGPLISFNPDEVDGRRQI
ncbi:hypothetical protein [Aliishimia ponticola]|uniref:hypothetical protein n=1 Tax=Aliishimia ponticola TaxID=2499833 RepID=UPI0014560349|nr:hypothetical protein [Aliishimia ponticola]